MSTADLATTGAPVPEPLSRALPRHVVTLLRLAWPVMLARAGILLMAFVDIAMLGRYGPGAPGIAGLGLAVFVPVMVVSIGLVSGLVPVVSRAWGAGDRAEAGRAWMRALSWGAFIALIGMVLVWHSGHILRLFDYPAATTEGARDVARALTPGLGAQVMFAASAFYLESTGRPLWSMTAMVVANIVNFALNWVLIFGHLGFPEMGATGSALASTFSRCAALAFLLWVILRQADIRQALAGGWGSIWGPGGWQAGAMMRRLGISAGVSGGFETTAFASMMLMAGTLGTVALDAYSISHNLVGTAFMFGLGLSIATGIRVAQAVGANDMREARLAGWTGVLVGLLIMGAAGVLVLCFRHQIAFVYTDVPALIARTTALFLFTAFVFVPDTLQVVLGQAVRATGDAWVPIGAYVTGFLVLMIPLGMALIGPAGWDERGLILAIICGCLTVGILLALRFAALMRRLARAS